MADFELSEMLLMSAGERRGRAIRFHPHLNVIFGKNDTGKSALIKSIYSTFGADPYTIHPAWAAAHVTSLVRFSWQGTEFNLVRSSDSFGVFDGSLNLVERFQGVTRGIGPFLAKLFGFDILLPNQQGHHIVPPPAFMFLPFYIDQDGGWNRNWASFKNLGQLKNWRRPLVEYHTGIRANEYYQMRGRLDVVKQDIGELGAELQVLQEVLRKVREEAEQVDFDVDIESFRDRIEELLRECETLRIEEERYKENLVSLYNQQHAITAQITVVDHAVSEAEADYRYAARTLIGSHVECPTCGATYDNSFAIRFSIARDEDRLLELLGMLRADLDEANSRIDAEDQRLRRIREDLGGLQRLLESKSADVSLATVLRIEGGKQVNTTFRSKIRGFQERIREREKERDLLEREIKNYNRDNQDRIESIQSYYIDRMRTNLRELSVSTLSESAYRAIDANIRETGSDLPRALLAYFFTILQVKRQYSPQLAFPIIIDSPNQNGQDYESLPLMLQFIRDHHPEDMQLILGLEDMTGVGFDGKVIELTEKYHLLRTEEYDEVSARIIPLLHDTLRL